MWSGCKDMRFQIQNRHILQDWLKIHVRGYEEHIPFIKAQELVKGAIKLGESDSEIILMKFGVVAKI